jgi:hypothetical protein
MLQLNHFRRRLVSHPLETAFEERLSLTPFIIVSLVIIVP